MQLILCVQHGGCDLWLWYDRADYASHFIKTVIVDLRDVARSLKKENGELKTVIDDGVARQEEHRAEARRLHHVIAEKEASNDELNKRVEKLEHEKYVLKLVIFAFVGLVFYLVWWK